MFIHRYAGRRAAARWLEINTDYGDVDRGKTESEWRGRAYGEEYMYRARKK